MKLYFPYLSSGCTSECQLTKYGGDWACLLHLSTQIFCLILYVCALDTHYAWYTLSVLQSLNNFSTKFILKIFFLLLLLLWLPLLLFGDYVYFGVQRENELEHEVCHSHYFTPKVLETFSRTLNFLLLSWLLLFFVVVVLYLLNAVFGYLSHVPVYLFLIWYTL